MKRLMLGCMGLVLVAGVVVCCGEGGPNVIQAKVGEDFKVVSESYSSKVKGQVGAGGGESWQFKALKAGETPLGFKYVRPWETNAVPGQVTNFVVRVEK
ncbi:protease inhibitor I42 family protein [Pedosphaera parvula]|nr:protease inhibitor I42 family protein [Pedosphaera parvula]